MVTLMVLTLVAAAAVAAAAASPLVGTVDWGGSWWLSYD